VPLLELQRYLVIFDEVFPQRLRTMHQIPSVTSAQIKSLSLIQRQHQRPQMELLFTDSFHENILLKLYQKQNGPACCVCRIFERQH
jgi:hypothetical protein